TFEDVSLWGPDGGHHVTTPERARAIDLKMAAAPFGGSCGDFTDDLTTPVFTADTFDQGLSLHQIICLKNAGAAPANKLITVKASITKVSDIDTAGTGQEADFDTTCGGGQQGEASPLLAASVFPVSCDAQNSVLGPGLDFGFFDSLTEVTLIN